MIQFLKGKKKAIAAAMLARQKAINEELWEIEDDIRDKERVKEFDERFIPPDRTDDGDHDPEHRDDRQRGHVGERAGTKQELVRSPTLQEHR